VVNKHTYLMQSFAQGVIWTCSVCNIDWSILHNMQVVHITHSKATFNMRGVAKPNKTGKHTRYTI